MRLTYILRACFLIFLVHSTCAKAVVDNERLERERMEEGYDYGLRTNLLEVLVQQDQDAHRKRDLDIIQAFGEIHRSMKNLEQRMDSLTLENQRWTAQLQTLTASQMAGEEETASFRLRMETEIQKQNISSSRSAVTVGTVAEVEPSPANGTEDTNQFQSVSSSDAPETEGRGPDQAPIYDYNLPELSGGNEWG